MFQTRTSKLSPNGWRGRIVSSLRIRQVLRTILPAVMAVTFAGVAQHTGTHRHIHINEPSGQFYDQQKNPITQPPSSFSNMK